MVFLGALGVVLAVYGLFGFFIVEAPWPIGVLCGGVLAYATVQTISGFWRA